MAFCALVLSAAPPALAEEAPDQQPKYILQLNDSYGSWSGDASPKKEGGQNLVYYSLGYMGAEKGITLLGSYSSTNYKYNDPAKSDFALSTLMDTTVSTYYVPPKLFDLNIRLGLDFNQPTGHASFSNAELASLMIDGVSKDLIQVPSFGKGFNIAPNVVVGRAFQNSLLGIGLRYEITGEYNPTKDVANKAYDPGDTLTLFGSLQYNRTPMDQFFIDLSNTYATRDKQGGAEVMKQGTSYNLGLRYVQGFETVKMTYGAFYGWQDKNQTYSGGGMTTEDRNSNNNRYELMVNGQYVYDPQLLLTGLFSYKNIIANGWQSTDPLYDAGYQKLTLGVGGTYALSNSVFFTVDVKGYQVWNGQDPMEPVAAVYKGVNIDLGFVYTWAPSPPPIDTAAAPEGIVPASASQSPAPVAPKEAPKETPKPEAKPEAVIQPKKQAEAIVAPPKPPVLMAELKKVEKPGAPAGVRAVFGNAKVTISWSPVDGADSYALYWSNGPGVKSEERNRIGGITGGEYEHTGLTNDTGYYYAVAAVNAGGEGAPSEQTFAIPRPSAPSAPAGISATAGKSKITLAWEAAPEASEYRILRSTALEEGGTTLANTPKTVYTDSAVINGQTYYYSVRGINSGGEGEASLVVSATPQGPPPPAPGGVSVSLTDKGVLIKWDAVPGARKYRLYRTTRLGLRGDWIFSGDVLSYVDENPVSDMTNYYVVRAVKGVAEGVLSPQAGILPEKR